MRPNNIWLLLNLLILIPAGPLWSQSDGARGITVGVPKAFDNRTLNLMLDNLNDSLAGLNVVDQKTLNQAIGSVQGSTLQETNTSLTIQGGTATSSGGDSPSSAKGLSATKSTAAAGSTDSSAGNDVPSAYTKLPYSLGASDLLNEQVDLMYQVFNLRMLIDRSLSDRLLSAPEASKDPPRLQTVIGLNVSIDPPRDAERSAAIIEVTLYRDKNSPPKDRPSLVSLMPQEHTYNSAALSSKSFAFGGSAVAKVISVGFTTTHRGRTYYLFRDNDTVSFEKPTEPAGNAITFGWQFRPVLGRRSVAPGMRQMFAVVSLPVDDEYADRLSGNARIIHLKADVRCWWVKYDPGSLTTATARELRPWNKIAHVLSLGTTLTYPPKGVTYNPGYLVDVPLTTAYLKDLEPDVKEASWHPVGPTQAVVTLKGQNFFADTRIAVGDRLLSGSRDGLRLISDQSLDFTTSVAALSADAAILGRYGPARSIEANHSSKGALRVLQAEFRQIAGGYSEVSLYPMFAKSSCLDSADLEDNALGTPVIFLNGAPLPGPYEYRPAGSGDCLQVIARIPPEIAKDLHGTLMLKFPFRGRQMQAFLPVYSPDSNYRSRAIDSRTYLLEKTDGPFVRAGQSSIAASNWRLIIGASSIPLQTSCMEGEPAKTTFCLLTPHDRFARLILVTAPAAGPKNARKATPKRSEPQGSQAAPKTVLLQYGPSRAPGSTEVDWNATYVIRLESGEESPPKPALDKNQKLELHQFDEVWQSFTGQNLNLLGTVMVGDIALRIHPAEDGKSISVFVPSSLTARPAQVDLTFFDRQSHQVGISQISVKKTGSGKE